MNEGLRIGDILFFKRPQRKIQECSVIEFDEKYVNVRFEKAIRTNNRYTAELKLPLTHIGEWLFFEKQHAGLNYTELATMELYVKYGNKEIEKVLEKQKKKEEEILKKQLEEKRKRDIIKNYQLVRKNELECIEEILRKRNVRDIVHFTRLDNLESILKYGLVPIENQSKYGITAVHNDENRYDGCLNCTSCSITFPNDKNFASFMIGYPDAEWVVLVLDSKVVTSLENVCYFCMTNAANKNMQGRWSEMSTPKALENMFLKEMIIYKFDSCETIERNFHLPENCTTDVQAEILISEDIDKKYIKKVIFKTESSKKKWCDEHKKLIQNIEIEVNVKYFSWRNRFV